MAFSTETPALPPGRSIRLPGRGETFIREAPGPPGAPTVLLLHGWFVNADLNWFHVFAPLAEKYHVVAIDHRGHGRGIRTTERFRLEDAADDAAALLDVLAIDAATVVGYSLGGPVAMNLWHRHPHRVSSLVLCATSREFSVTRLERLEFPALRPLSQSVRLVPHRYRQAVFQRLVEWRVGTTKFSPWMREQILLGEPRLLLEAGAALGRFDATSWIGEIEPDTAVAVLVVTDDTMVPSARQWALAQAIPHARVFRATGTHDTPVLYPKKFVPPFLDAVDYAAGMAKSPSTTAGKPPS